MRRFSPLRRFTPGNHVMALARGVLIAGMLITAPAAHADDPPTRPLTTRPSAGKSVQLLALLDAEAARLDQYALRDGVLLTHGHDAARMTLPYAPGPEYDLDADFVRTSGDECVAVTFPVGRSNCTLCLGGNTNRDAWLGNVDGVWSEKENPTRVPLALANGHRYRVTVRVRRDGVAAYLDGKPLCAYRTDGHDVCAAREFAARSSRLIAVGSYRSVVEFHAVEVTALSGEGVVATERAEDGRPLNPLAVAARPDGAYELAAADGTAHGPGLFFQRSMHAAAVAGGPEENPEGVRNFGGWKDGTEYISWVVDVREAGPFAVALTYACPPAEEGSDVEVTFEGLPPLPLAVESTGGWHTFRRAALGVAVLPAGRFTVALRARRKAHDQVMDVERITLIPAQGK